MSGDSVVIEDLVTPWSEIDIPVQILPDMSMARSGGVFIATDCSGEPFIVFDKFFYEICVELECIDFVMAHERAHYLLGHFDKETDKKYSRFKEPEFEMDVAADLAALAYSDKGAMVRSQFAVMEYYRDREVYERNLKAYRRWWKPEYIAKKQWANDLTKLADRLHKRMSIAKRLCFTETN